MEPKPFLNYEEMLKFLQCAPVDLFFKDVEGRYLYISDSITKDRGDTESQVGKTDWEIHPESARAAHYWAEDRKILTTGQSCEYVLEVQRPQGRKIFQVKKNPVVVNGETIGIVGAFNDITARVQLEREQEERSFKDHLTDLYNRNYLEVRAKHELQSAPLPITVVMGDCNGLKKTNDTYGHDYGDLLLKRVARVLRTSLPEHCTALRLGGDEFMLLCCGVDAAQTEALLAVIQDRLARESDDRIPLSVAFGSCTVTEGPFSFPDAYRRADQAMYENKRKMR